MSHQPIASFADFCQDFEGNIKDCTEELDLDVGV